MTFDEYQADAMRTASDMSLATLALGVCGEAGEIAEIVKKYRGHGHGIDRSAFAKEIGDVLWYLAALCEREGMSLDAVAYGNIEKLRARYPDGFSEERSRERCDQ